MSLSLVVLQNGSVLVGISDELEYEPKVHLRKPFSVSGDKNAVLTQWPTKWTEDEDILLRSTDLLTVCEPSESLVKSYLRKTGLKESDLNPTPQQVILNEESEPTQPDLSDFPEDDYEPAYTEL